METASEILKALGGTTAVAVGTGISLGTVSSWATRDSIGKEYWADLIAFAEASGHADVTYEVLALHAARRRSLRAAVA